MSYLAPYLPTIVLVLLAAFFIGADLIKGKNVYKEEKKKKKQEIIDEHEEKCSIQDEFKALHSRFDEIDRRLAALEERMGTAEERLNTLTESDMNDIKSWIVEQYHKFYGHQGWIDAYSADTIERRFGDYQAEGGNSYVHNLVNQLRTLPMDPDEKK